MLFLHFQRSSSHELVCSKFKCKAQRLSYLFTFTTSVQLSCSMFSRGVFLSRRTAVKLANHVCGPPTRLFLRVGSHSDDVNFITVCLKDVSYCRQVLCRCASVDRSYIFGRSPAILCVDTSRNDLPGEKERKDSPPPALANTPYQLMSLHLSPRSPSGTSFHCYNFRLHQPICSYVVQLTDYLPW